MQKLQIDSNIWATLNLLLDEALDQPAEARAAWIERLAPEFSGSSHAFRRCSCALRKSRPTMR
jgi:hypothetical protein